MHKHIVLFFATGDSKYKLQKCVQEFRGNEFQISNQLIIMSNIVLLTIQLFFITLRIATPFYILIASLLGS